MNDAAERLTENPGSVVFARHAEKLAREGRLDEALDILDHGIGANPFYAHGHSVLASVYFIQGEREKATDELKIALQLDPQIVADLVRIGSFLLDANPMEAEPYLRTACVYEPGVDDIRVMYERAASEPVIIHDEGGTAAETLVGDEAGISEGDGESGEDAAAGTAIGGTVSTDADTMIVMPEPDEEIARSDEQPTDAQAGDDEDYLASLDIDGLMARAGLDEEDDLEAGLGADEGDAPGEETDMTPAVPVEEMGTGPDATLPGGDAKTDTDEAMVPDDDDFELPAFLDEPEVDDVIITPAVNGDATTVISIDGDISVADDGEESGGTLTQAADGGDMVDDAPVPDDGTGMDAASTMTDSTPDDADDVSHDALTVSMPAYHDTDGESTAKPEDEAPDTSLDIAALLESFGDNEDDETPTTPAGGENGASGQDGGPVADAGVTGDGAGTPGAVLNALEYGIPGDDDFPEEKILDIEDEGEFDLAAFGFGADDDGEPVMSEEEKRELESLGESSPDDDVTMPPAIDAAEDELSGGDTAPTGFYGGQLSGEEIDALSHNDEVDGADGAADTDEGIDYSDVLAAHGRTVHADGLDAFEESLEDAGAASLSPGQDDETGYSSGAADEPDGHLPGQDSGAANDTRAAWEGAVEQSERHIEDLIRAAPDMHFFYDAGMAGFEAHAEPLGTLIDQYSELISGEHVLEASAPPVAIAEVMPAPVHAPAPVSAPPAAPMTETAVDDEPYPLDAETGTPIADGDVTATMAEIYLAQGLHEQAIHIYTMLVEKNPGNQSARARLNELSASFDQQDEP